jgi:hypothetical protein
MNFELSGLRPTQIALGYIHVRLKMAQTEQVERPELDTFLSERALVVVRGPASRFHIIDHHHWARAWLELGMMQAPVKIVADFTALDERAFIVEMRRRGWFHPYDQYGKEVSLGDIPTNLWDMPDDPYQSLAAFVRSAGVYVNPGEINAKFAWADFLRIRVPANASTIEGFADMLATALRMSRMPQASTLPGFAG